MTTPVTTGTVPVNGLEMYYEIYGEGQPLVLLHGAFSAIDSSFGALIPGLAEGRKVVGFELQGHGRTADIDRPLSNEAMADDVAAAIEQMELGPVDLYGYSMGAFVALLVTLRHPQLVRKLVFMSATYTMSGVHPGLMDGLGEMTPEMMVGSEWHEEYMRIAPRPEDFETLFAKKTAMDQGYQDQRDEDIAAIEAPDARDHRRLRSGASGTRRRDVPVARWRRVRRHAARHAGIATRGDTGGLARVHPVARRPPGAHRHGVPRCPDAGARLTAWLRFRRPVRGRRPGSAGRSSSDSSRSRGRLRPRDPTTASSRRR